MASCVSVPSVCVCLHAAGIYAQLGNGLNLQRGKQELFPPGWAETPVPRHWLGTSSWAGPVLAQ